MLWNKKLIFGAMIAAGLIWQVAYSAGYRAGTQDTSDATLAAAEIAIQNAQDRERQIARWTATGCHGAADCGDMERGRLAGWQYRPMDGEWITEY